jgi:glutamate racemase
VDNRPVGFLDSGLGGISVLGEALRVLPNENFLYYGDTLHIPYGDKPPELIFRYTHEAIDCLLQRGCKAIVIACNTATGAAIQDLRQKYPEIPTIGREPAIKPAVTAYPGGRVLVMATPLTLSSPRFRKLMDAHAARAQIIPAPCSKLARMIENGTLAGVVLEEYLLSELAEYLQTPPDAVVLGCTHYPFVADTILRVTGAGKLFDGGAGTAKETERQLKERGWLREDTRKGSVTILNSDPDLARLRLCEKLLGMDADT